MPTPPSRLRPLLAAVLCLLLAASSVLATEPDPTPGPPAEIPAAEPSVGPAANPSAAPPVEPSVEPGVEPSPAPPVDPSVEPPLAPPAAQPSVQPSAEPSVAPPSIEPSAEPSPAPAADPAPGDPASGQVIVILREGTNVDAATSRARGLGARVERAFRSAVRAYAATVSPGQARRLAADPRVVAVVPDDVITADEALAAQKVPTGIKRVYANKSAAARINGLDERVDADVAIYDTGIDPTHTDLNVVGGYNCTSSDRSNWKDEQGHGTHVAGTVGAIDNGSGVVGVAPGVRLWAVRILDAKGEGRLSWWLCGVDWIAAQRDPVDSSRPLIEAVNMSVTRWGTDDRNCGYTNNDLLHQAICRVVAGGTTVVVAAANDAASAAKRTPGSYNEVITVSALADTDGKPGALGGNLCYSWGTYDKDDTFANFSNFGADVDLIAPGKCIWSTLRNQSYGYSSGTSMAAPHVTGAAALYLASRPGASPSEVRWALRHLGNLNWKTSTDPDGRPDILLDLSRLGPLGDFAPSATLPAGGLVTNELGATWTIPLAAGRGTNFVEPIAFSVASAAAPLSAAISGSTSLSGTASATAVRITVPRATPAGTYEVVVRAAYRTLRVRDVRLAVVVENQPPVASAPVAALRRGARASLSTVPLALTWRAAVDQSPIARYQVGEGLAGYEPAAVASTGSATRTATRRIPFAARRAYAVRAIDLPGNLGAWATAAPVQVAVVQESSTTVRKSAGWTRVASTGSLGGRSIYASRAGAWVRYSFKGSAIAVVGRKGRGFGRADIRIDGVLVGSVGAHAKKTSRRWLLFAKAVDPSRTHTIEVRVRGTAGHPRFDVDAFLVLK